MKALPNFAVVVPVMNGGEAWRQSAEKIASQSVKPSRILVIDSESTDGSDHVALNAGFELLRIRRQEFDHGGTREKAARILADHEVIVFMTQDAILTGPEALAHLVSIFENLQVGAAYGRQLPRKNAGLIEAHARMFNYPKESKFNTFHDIPRLGIKAAFASNSFAAYRTGALFSVGGFPERLILSEDMAVFARMLIDGWTVAYVADACVRHSHHYNLIQEFKRYFDIGVLHRDQYWLLEQLGTPDSEGLRFVHSELEYLMKRAPWLIPLSVTHAAAKYLGYKLGRRFPFIPIRLCRKMSMNPGYWDNHTENR